MAGLSVGGAACATAGRRAFPLTNVCAGSGPHRASTEGSASAPQPATGLWPVPVLIGELLGLVSSGIFHSEVNEVLKEGRPQQPGTDQKVVLKPLRLCLPAKTLLLLPGLP